MSYVNTIFQSEIFSYIAVFLSAVAISIGLFLFSKSGGKYHKIIASRIGTFLGVTFLFIVTVTRFSRRKFDAFSLILALVGIIFTLVGLSLWKSSFTEGQKQEEEKT